jgi:hypothetical protein
MGTNRPTTLQSITVEYTVTGSLDGTTLAPEVIIDQNDPNRTRFDQGAQIYLPDPVESLGLIDPDLLLGGSIGPRCIPFLTLDTTETGLAGAALDVVAVRADPGDVFLQKQIRDLDGVAGPVYIEDNFNVAQGSNLRLSGYVAGAEPIRVRVSVMVIQSCAELGAGDAGNGEPVEPCCPPIVAGFAVDGAQVIPSNSLNRLLLELDGSAAQTFIFGVKKFDDPNAGGTLSVGTVPFQETLPFPIIVDATLTPNADPEFDELEVVIDSSAIGDPGIWELVLENKCGCCVSLPMEFVPA